MQEQQARQKEIQTVKEDISKKDQEILNLESQLKEAEKILVSMEKSNTSWNKDFLMGFLMSSCQLVLITSWHYNKNGWV